MEKKTTIGEVVAYLNQRLQPQLQEEWDNSGFLLGESKAEYTGALVALDLTPEVIEEAAAMGANLIATHHPFIYTGVKRITEGSEVGRMILSLVKKGIAVYAAHTNLDNLAWGVSGILAEKIGLKNCTVMSPLGGEIGAGMVGQLEEAEEADALITRIKTLMGAPVIKTSKHDAHAKVMRVALCGGSGAPFIGDAIAAKADLYLTGDLKYHDFQRAEGGIILADGGHYETEQFAKEIICGVISEKFSKFACRISAQQKSIVHYI
jgi:dinuclear metal center YbgI/SA1388 family protein